MPEIGTTIHRLIAIQSNDSGEGVVSPPPAPVGAIFRRFWPYARPYRRWLWLTLVFVILAPVIDTATIWLFKLLVDDVLAPRNFRPFGVIALAYVGLTVLDGLVSFCDDVLSAWVGERFLLSLRTSFFRHLHTLSLDFFERRRLGDMLSRLTNDIASIEDLVLSGVARALSYALRLIFFAGALFYLQRDLALVALVVTPIFWLMARRFSRLIKQAAREQRRRSGSISATAEEETIAAARAADAHEFVMAFPDGYDTIVGQRGRRLSGGQRQRVAIARAMIRNAPVLVLDEPTTGLDTESEERILEPLRRLMHGRTTIVISHNLLTTRQASAIVLLQDGRIVEQGSHPELLAKEGDFARLYALRQGGASVNAPLPVAKGVPIP